MTSLYKKRRDAAIKKINKYVIDFISEYSPKALNNWDENALGEILESSLLERTNEPIGERPKQPINSFLKFSMSRRPHYNDSGLTIVEIAKRIGEDWNNLPWSERNAYKESYHNELAEYHKLLTKIDLPKIKPIKKSNKDPENDTPFVQFSRVEREKIKNERNEDNTRKYPTTKDVCAELTKRWKAQKQPKAMGKIPYYNYYNYRLRVLKENSGDVELDDLRVIIKKEWEEIKKNNKVGEWTRKEDFNEDSKENVDEKETREEDAEEEKRRVEKKTDEKEKRKVEKNADEKEREEDDAEEEKVDDNETREEDSKDVKTERKIVERKKDTESETIISVKDIEKKTTKNVKSKDKKKRSKK